MHFKTLFLQHANYCKKESAFDNESNGFWNVVLVKI